MITIRAVYHGEEETGLAGDANPKARRTTSSLAVKKRVVGV